MPRVRLLIFFNCSTIVSLGATKKSWFPGMRSNVQYLGNPRVGPQPAIKKKYDGSNIVPPKPQVVTVTPSILTNNLPFGSVGVFPLTSPLLIRKTTAPLLCRPSKKPRGAPLCLNYLPNPLLKQSAFPFYMFLFPFYLCKTFTRWPLLPPPICNPLEYKRTTRISYRVFVCDVARYGTLASQPRCAPEKPCLF